MQKFLFKSLACLFVFSFASTAKALDRTVPFPYSTIQAAINAAQSGDKVRIYPGTYVERINLGGRNITIEPANSNYPPTLDGGGVGSVITFAGNEPPTCVVKNLTIQNGGGNGGGAIRGNFSFATIRGCKIQFNNVSGNGGGISGHSGLIEKCTFTGNKAVQGAAISGSESTIRNCTFTSNEASESGGAIAGCTGLIEANTFLSNKAAARGGAIYNCSGIISRNRIQNNEVTIIGTQQNPGSFGGAVASCSGSLLHNLILENSSQGNSGGVDSHSGPMINNIIFANSARNGGGMSSCTGLIANNTIYGNVALQAGGGVRDCGTMVNCIIWGNIAQSSTQMLGDNDPNYCCIQDWFGGGIGNISTGPALVNPSGGNFRLLQSSQCIDAGTSIAAVQIDYDGEPRGTTGTTEMRGDGKRYDIGADEYVPPHVNLTGLWTAANVTYKTSKAGVKANLKASVNITCAGNVATTTTAAVRFVLSNDLNVDAGDIPVGKIHLLKPMRSGTMKSLKVTGKLPIGFVATNKWLLADIDYTGVVTELFENDNVVPAGPLP